MCVCVFVYNPAFGCQRSRNLCVCVCISFLPFSFLPSFPPIPFLLCLLPHLPFPFSCTDLWEPFSIQLWNLREMRRPDPLGSSQRTVSAVSSPAGRTQLGQQTVSGALSPDRTIDTNLTSLAGLAGVRGSRRFRPNLNRLLRCTVICVDCVELQE